MVAILTIVYFAVSSGVVMSSHYCMGRLSSVNLELAATKKCACGKEEPKKCCKNELKVIKIEDTQKAASAAYDIQAPVTLMAGEVGIFVSPAFVPAAYQLYRSYSPPLLFEQDTYLQNGVFRI